MALVVGELVVELEANSKALTTDLRGTEQQTNRTVRALEAGANNVESAMRTLASAVGVVTSALSVANTVGFNFSRRLLLIARFIPPLRVALLGLAAAGGLIAFNRIADQGVELAASFEQIEVALGTLTGSTASAAAVLREVEEVVLATPFGITELSNVARQLAVVFGNDADQIAEFTRITADIAAVSGKSVEQIGSQIQRAVSSGLASAEVLREAGISQLLLDVAGAEDVAELRGQRLLEAFRALTSEGGKAFGAAAAQARTIEGAVSNAAIAQENFTRAIGESFARSTVQRANATERAFVNLREVVEDFQPILSALAQTLVFLRNSVVFVGVAIARIVGLVGAELTLAFQTVRLAIVAVATVLELLGRVVGQTLLAAFRFLTGDIRGARAALADIANVVRDSPVFQLLADTAILAVRELENVSNAVRGFLRSLGIAIEDTNAFAEEQMALAAAQDEAAKRTRDETDALNDLIAVQRGLTGETTVDRIAALDTELERVRALVVAKEDEAEKERTLLSLQQERERLVRLQASATANLDSTIRAANEGIRELAELDPEQAARAAVELSQAITSEGADPVARIQAIARVRQQILDQIRAENQRIATEEQRLAERTAEERRRAGERLVESIGAAQLEALQGQERELEAVRRLISETERVELLAESEEARRTRLVQLRTEEARLEAEIAASAQQRGVDLARAVAAQGESARERSIFNQIEATRELIRETEELQLLAGAEETRAERLVQLNGTLLDLDRQRAEAAAERARAETEQPGLVADLQREIATADRRAPELGERIREELQRALEIEDPGRRIAAIEDLLTQVRERMPPTISEGIAEGFATELTGGFFDALRGDSVNFASSFGESLKEFAAKGLRDAFDESRESLANAFTGALGSLDRGLGSIFGGQGEGGGLFGGAGGIFGEGGFFDNQLFEGAGELIGQGAVGIIGSAISAFGQEDQITSEAGNIRSAVTSAERVRGIVAGPTSIAVAQVDRAISDAFVETNQILALIERNTRSAPGANNAPTGSVQTGGSDTATDILANEGTSFL